MLTVSVENMLVTSIDTTLKTGVVPSQYIVIISTVRQQSEVGIKRRIDFGPIVNFCLGVGNDLSDRNLSHMIKTKLNYFYKYFEIP